MGAQFSKKLSRSSRSSGSFSFTATAGDGQVLLAWETGSELENLGFYLYRSMSAGGPYEQITANVIPGLGSSPHGARYSYRDLGLTNDVTYYYKLEVGDWSDTKAMVLLK